MDEHWFAGRNHLTKMAPALSGVASATETLEPSPGT
jgi:hypothetical protein